MAMKNWARILFIENPHLFLPELEQQMEHAEEEVVGLCRIFNEMGFNEQSRILDLSCGIGRHAIALAKRGYYVVGYDPSKFFLDIARDRAKTELGNTKNLSFYTGDIDSVDKILHDNSEKDFDIIISMCNSIGYTDTKDDLDLFRRILELSVDDAILVTETENRDWRLRNFFPFINHDYGNLQVYEKWEFNFENSVAQSTSCFYQKNHSVDGLSFLLNLSIRLRLYSLHELKDLLNLSGWTFIKSYGGLSSLCPANSDAFEIVTISKKIKRTNTH
jgi:SAM-dependent methyltransferase